MKKVLTFCLCFSFFFCSVCFSLPQGYGDLKLGMSTEDAKDALKNNVDFGYRGDKDVSLLPGEERTLIQSSSAKQEYSFFDNTILQFQDDSLYIITLNLKAQKIDYISLFNALNQKYGEPSSFSPSGAVWQDDAVIFCLEKPLTLKYTDAKKQKDLQDKQGVQESVQEKTTKEFLESL